MPQDPAKRIDRWCSKVTPERASTDLTALNPTMQVNFGVTANEQVQSDQQVRQCLNASGVPTIQYPFYLNFGRQCKKLLRASIDGESVAQEAAVLIAYWTAQGLTQSVLTAIRSQVFNIGAPVGP
jgi:hypothetical protein